MNTLGTYGITYESGVYQEKNLISHDDYLNVIVPTYNKIAELEEKKKKKESGKLKSYLVEEFGEMWFTDKSTLYKSIKSGILELPKHQGGNKKVKVKRL